MTWPFYLSYVALWILVVFQTLVLLGLLRRVYRGEGGRPVSSDEREGPEIGMEIPPFSALDIHGRTIDNTSLAGHQTALLFVSPMCSTCGVTLDELEALRLKTRGHVIVFCRASQGDCTELAERYGLKVPVVVDEDLRISEMLGVAATPTAVLVGNSGRVETYGQPMSPAEFEGLIAENAGRAQRVPDDEGVVASHG